MPLTKNIYGEDLPASSFLHVPDASSPATWALPVKDAKGNPDPGMIAKAAALLSPEGLKGQTISLPVEVKTVIKSKLTALYRRIGRGPGEIPNHLYEHKSEEDIDPGTVATLPTGEIVGVSEIEHKGMRGLRIEAIINSLSPDRRRDWAVLTPELKASTTDYLTNRPAVMVEHGLPYRGKSPVKQVLGFTIDHSFEDEGIRVVDFVPEPAAKAPAEVKRAYQEFKNGEFTHVSVSGEFYRDTGLHQPPGMIYDWFLVEHTYCQNPMDGNAPVRSISELKSLLDADPAEQLVELKTGLAGLPTTVTQPITVAANPPQTEERMSKDITPGTGAPETNTDPTTKLLADMSAKLAALEAKEQEAERKTMEAQRLAEAERVGAESAKKIAEAQALEKKTFDDAVAAATQKHLANYQIVPMGAGFTVPNLNLNADYQKPTEGDRMTMRGLVREAKSLIGDDGKPLPNRLIDYIQGVKTGLYTGRLAQFGGPVEQIEGKIMVNGVPTQTTSPAGSAGGVALPVQYLTDIIPQLVDQTSIRNYVQVLPAEALILEVPRASTAPTRAAVVAENTTKPQLTFGLDMLAIRMFVVPMIVDITNQLLRFSRSTAEGLLRDGLVDSIRLAEFYYVMQGAGTTEPNGLITALDAAQVATPALQYKLNQGAGLDVDGVSTVDPTETIADFVARGINAQDNRHYTTSALMVHNNVFWKLQKTKDNQGRYLIDPAANGVSQNSVWGMPVVRNSLMPTTKGVMGDWKKMRMYVADDLMLDMSDQAGTRWDKNVTGFRAEEMFGCDASQEINAFTELIFS